MKNKKFRPVFLALLCLTLAACGSTSVGVIGGADGPTSIIVSDKAGKEATYEQIDQDKAHALMQGENCLILDVRTRPEYDEYHIVGAVCLPNEEIGDTESELLTDKEQLILVYCRSGRRSKEAALKLAKLGYTNIKEFGGINIWPYETEPSK